MAKDFVVRIANQRIQMASPTLWTWDMWDNLDQMGHHYANRAREIMTSTLLGAILNATNVEASDT